MIKEFQENHEKKEKMVEFWFVIQVFFMDTSSARITDATKKSWKPRMMTWLPDMRLCASIRNDCFPSACGIQISYKCMVYFSGIIVFFSDDGFEKQLIDK